MREGGNERGGLIELEKPLDESAVELCISRRLLQSRSFPRKLVLKIDEDDRWDSFEEFRGVLPLKEGKKQDKVVKNPQVHW